MKITRLIWEPIGETLSIMRLPNKTFIIGSSDLACGPADVISEDGDFFVRNREDMLALKQHLLVHYSADPSDVERLTLAVLEDLS